MNAWNVIWSSLAVRMAFVCSRWDIKELKLPQRLTIQKLSNHHFTSDLSLAITINIVEELVSLQASLNSEAQKHFSTLATNDGEELGMTTVHVHSYDHMRDNLSSVLISQCHELEGSIIQNLSWFMWNCIWMRCLQVQAACPQWGWGWATQARHKSDVKNIDRPRNMFASHISMLMPVAGQSLRVAMPCHQNFSSQNYFKTTSKYLPTPMSR